MAMLRRDNRRPDRVTALASCEGLVKNMARRYAKGNPTREEDLEQEGRIGLIYAADRFDPGRGVKFISYAGELARGEMQHSLRAHAFPIRVPAWMQDRLRKISQATVVMEAETGSEPLPAEVAKRIGLSEARVLEALAVENRSRVVSLDAPEGEEGVPSLDLERLRIETQDDGRLPIEDRLFIEAAIGSLPRLQREVVALYFYQDLTQSEIARHLGWSQNYISYLLKGAMSRLRVAGEACMEDMR